jgi:hypothetical protein
MEISKEETARFERFLDRSFPGWRDREVSRATDAGSVTREWLVGVDEIIRQAIYRRQIVEVYDDFIGWDESVEAVIHFMKNIICDIDGDLTHAATWES